MLLMVACGDSRLAIESADDVAATTGEYSYRQEGDYVVPLGKNGEQLERALTVRSAQVVYLNFDGAWITKGGWAQNNAQTNTSFIPATNAYVPPFDPGPFGMSRDDAIMWTIIGLQFIDFNGWQVSFTSTRPASGPYTMMMIGGRAENLGLSGNYGGLSPLDTGNTNHNDVGFVFSETMGAYGYTHRQLTWTIAHELAHTVGLKHIAPGSDIMNAVACHCDQGWGAGAVTDASGGYQDDRAALDSVFLHTGELPAGPAPLFNWSSAGATPGQSCTQIVEPGDPHTWNDNFFCSAVDQGIRWSYAGPIAGMRCTQIFEGADPHYWNDNYLCVPPTSPIRFSWSSAGAIAGKKCVQWSEPADPDTWNDNFLCYDEPFVFSYRGAIADLSCVQISEPSDPHTWNDNFLCSPTTQGIRWSNAGPISGMRCTQITEGADRDSWGDNYVCVATTSPYVFSWSSAGPIAGKTCVQWLEPADPDTWSDNYLCY